MDFDEKIIKLGELNALAYEDLLLSINTSFSIGKFVFGLVRNVKSADFPEGNCKITGARLVGKHALHTALSLLKLKNKFHDCKLELIEKDPDEWISTLEVLRIQMNKFALRGKTIDENFMIHEKSL